MYAVYDMKNNEQCIGIFDTRKEIAKYFNTTANCIGSEITRKQKRKHRYLIKKLKKEKN